MKLPKSVNVLGRKIPVKYKDRKSMEVYHKDAAGLWLADLREIWILKDQPIQSQLLFIYHEATHAMHFFTGIDQNLPGEFIEVLCQCNASLIEDLMGNQKRIRKTVKK